MCSMCRVKNINWKTEHKKNIQLFQPYKKKDQEQAYAHSRSFLEYRLLYSLITRL